MSTHAGGARKQTGTKPAARASKSKAAKDLAPGKVHEIPLSSIHVGLNPREHFDPEGIHELAQSIREHGLLQPITVRPHEGGYQLVAGERRYRAMKELGRDTVPALVRTMSDQEAHELALIENVARQDMRPTETAKAYEALTHRGLSVGDISQRTGKSEASIQHYLAIRSMEPHLQKLVDDGKLHLSVVTGLSKLSAKGREEAAERILRGDLGVRSTNALIRSIRDREAQISMFTSRAASKQELDAKGRYEEAVKRITDSLHGLDDETMAAYARILDSPFRESQRLDLMAKQIRRMQSALEYAGHARGEGAA